MSDRLPDSWAEARLGDVCEPVSQRGPSAEHETFRYIDLGAIDNRAKRVAEATGVPVLKAPSRAKQVVRYGDVVFSTVRVYLENIAEVPGELDGEIASTAFCVLRPAQGISSRYLYHYVLETLSTKPGLVGTIFRKAQNKLTDPAKLKRVVSLIDSETWIGSGVDVKGAIYEGPLEKNAAEVKSGAGQYFTRRPLIDAMVEVIDPRVGETVHDPACGTGGFLLSAYEHMKPNARDRSEQRKLREQSLSGVDIVDEVVRLCAMNMYLHGIGNGESPIACRDALAFDPGDRYDVILTNPPFGRKSSYRVIGEDGEVDTEREDYEREDFKFTTSNKQLNFLQHIMTIMQMGGRAVVVLPDNVLFEAGSAGEGIRRRLLERFDFHTLVRLPTGIFYKPGVKANVLFFNKHPPRADNKPNTRALWIYDFRTNRNFTLKKNPLARADLDDFVACYQASNRSKRKESERFRKFDVADLLKRDKLNLDILWLKDDSLEDVNSLPPPDEIAIEIVENLQAALEAFQAVADDLQKPQAPVVVDIADARRKRDASRAAVGCYVIGKLADTPTFGRTVEMKLLYLAEAHLGLELEGQPIRDAAGPYDPWIREFEKQAVQANWFAVDEKDIGTGPSKMSYKIKPGLKAKVDEAVAVLGDQQVEFDRVIGLLAGKPTEDAEILTTLFAAWNDALLDELSPPDEDIIREVRENWHLDKARFSIDTLKKWLDWMRSNRLTPMGKPPRTRHQAKLL